MQKKLEKKTITVKTHKLAGYTHTDASELQLTTWDAPQLDTAKKTTTFFSASKAVQDFFPSIQAIDMG